MKLSMRRLSLFLLALPFAALFTGCVTVEPYDYSALKQSAPRSILVLPPVNESLEEAGTYGYFTTVTQPLAELGYYVFPIGLVDEFLKANGLPTPHEMHQAPLDRLYEVFQADAVLYITLLRYGTSYAVIRSATTVSADARLVDGRSGQLLWDGRLHAEHAPGSGGGIVEALVAAVVNQIIGQITDQGHTVSRMANNQIGRPTNGLLPGPYKRD